MATYIVHHSSSGPYVYVYGGSDYFLRARWATQFALLATPESVTGPVYVATAPTLDSPVVLPLDAVFWTTVRDGERTIFVAIDWQDNSPGSTWQQFDAHTFLINHDPICNPGPDQQVIVDATGSLANDVVLDASASDDGDLHVPGYSDPGPLQFDWWPTETPLSVTPNGTTWTAAYGLAAVAQPTFLPAGAFVPFSDRGAYTFRCWVYDTEYTDIGAYSGQRGVHSAETRVLLAVGGPLLNIQSPTTANPFFANVEDGLDARIYYSIGDVIANDPAYAGAWVIQCRITVAESSPIFPFNLPGTVVYEKAMVSFQRVNYFTWNGRESGTGAACAGAFDVEIELLDRDWQSTGVTGAVAKASRVIVIDFVRWLLPIDAAHASAAISGGFMESGHAGTLGTRLHTGIDIISIGGGQPDLIASRSGFFARAGHEITLTHAPPDLTMYLHGDTFEPHINGALVLQGQRLARMSNTGTVAVHLHFEHHIMPPQIIENPFGILSLRDERAPVIEAVSIRTAAAAGNPADLTLAGTGIMGNADLIIRCRDRAHPLRGGGAADLENGPYSVQVVELNGVAVWPQIEFNAMTAANHLREFFALQGQFGSALTRNNHYLPYLRWDTTVYGRTISPLQLHVVVADFVGATAVHALSLGPTTVLSTPPPNPAMTVGAPANVPIQITVTNNSAGIDGVANEDFHVELVGAPVGWTITPARTGAINNGAASVVAFTIRHNGNAPQGTHNFHVVVSSNILRSVGTRVPVSVRIAP